MLDPSYRPGVSRLLDRLEADNSKDQLWRAIVKCLHLICDEPESKEARERQIRTGNGDIFNFVGVWAPQETEDWCILWAPDGDEAVFVYIGTWPPSWKYYAGE